MQKLKCGEYGCCHNYCNHCVKDVVQVSNKGVCKSYDNTNTKNLNNAKHEFEFACDVGLNTENDLHHILCNDEQCDYWNFGECNAKEIKVVSKGSCARCETFKQKTSNI